MLVMRGDRMPQFDVLVVGARCAGAPLALLLARRGLRVCLLDRARFPSDTPSTHVIQPNGVAVLERLGVLDTIAAAQPAVIDRFTMAYDDVRIEGDLDLRRSPSAPFDGAGLCIRRHVLDAILVDAAAAGGADVRTGTIVIGVVAKEGRAFGVRTVHGEITSTLVVGADGRRSTVAREVDATTYYVEPAGRLFSWGYFTGAASTEGRLRIGRIGPYAYAAAPTDAGHYLAAVSPPMSCKAEFLADRERGYQAGLAAWPELAELVGGATRVGPLRVVADWQSYFRAAAGPGWVLVGDAGHFKDPSPAQGMADALRHTERLADVIERGFASGNLDAELARWWRWRDDDTREMHWFAADIGSAGDPTPVVTEFMRGLSRSPGGAIDLLRVLNHELRPDELLTNRRVALATLRALRRPRQLRAIGTELRAFARTDARRRREKMAW
jgi:2-polyprenyl-6-methoxyphenol hydroxylase-like FAD-dependent oxidoreductase